MKERRTNWDRVAELNEILGPVTEKYGYFFGLLKNAREHKHPYCLLYKWEVKCSLNYRGMKEMALRMRAAYDNGGDRKSVYDAIYAN